MQLNQITILPYQKSDYQRQDCYVQTMKNKLYLLDLYRKRMINTPVLIEYRIHFRFYAVNRHRISIPLLEKRKIEFTQIIVAP
jgi:hypothetical protein